MRCPPGPHSEELIRIGVSGSHGTGKSTLAAALCDRLGCQGVDEPYVLLADEGWDFEDPPTAAEYLMQLDRSLEELSDPVPDVVFDRTPLDLLAYLAACGVDLETTVDAGAVRRGLDTLDLLVLLPITAATERVLPPVEMDALRQRVNEALLDLVYADPLELTADLSVVGLTGPPAGRVDAVLAALA